MTDLADEAREVSRLQTRLEGAELAEENEGLLYGKASKQADRCLAAQEMLQLVAQAVQLQVHQHVCKVVTSCLEAVFGDVAYKFEIQFERKRGKTEAALRFTRDGMDLNPLDSTGGGMVDVAAFALRAAALVLHRPRLSRVIILDEPFRFVSAGYRDNVRKMLERLSADMGIQIIMVTHMEELATGKVIEL